MKYNKTTKQWHKALPFTLLSLSLFAAAVLTGCEREETEPLPSPVVSSPLASKVFAYLPAPGQFVNDGYTCRTMDEACRYAEERLAQTAHVSLGGFGGYIVVGFDHRVMNDGDYDLAVTGNAFHNSSEPGIVWVMQDSNGNGLPDDTWYELRGSEYGKEGTWADYAVTYYRPEKPQQPVRWTDNRGQSGEVDYLTAYHHQDFYYPLWIEADSLTLCGTRLAARNRDLSGSGVSWVNEDFEWGYADNYSPTDMLSEKTRDNHFRISDAVCADGSTANLPYIDFVKIQTATNAKSGWLGENSTEILAVKDYHMEKGGGLSLEK